MTTIKNPARSAPPVDFDAYGTIYDPKGLPPAPFDLAGKTAYPFRGRVGEEDFPAEPGRYHLYVSFACPFAHRTLIARALKGLEETISVSVVDPIRDGRGWAFREGPGQTLDTGGNGFAFLSEAYEASSPGGYVGRVSVPLFWDKKRNVAVSNYFPDITLDLGGKFNPWAGNPEVDLYGESLRADIDRLNDFIAHNINEGVYRAGFAENQETYNQAVEDVFAALDSLEQRLSDRRPYLFGAAVTESDLRLWVTLIRFDTVYYGHFKVNLRPLAAYPRLWSYTKRLYALPAFRNTTNFDHIKRHYYNTQRHINPRGIVPLGPYINFEE